MAISKIIYKSSAEATPEVWMDATTATAAAANIIAPYTAMLADGVMTTGTGSGGGGGLEYETGTWTPSEDIARGTVSFQNQHNTAPCFYAVADMSQNSTLTQNSNTFLQFFYTEQAFGAGVPYNTGNYYRYAHGVYNYISSNNSTTITGFNCGQHGSSDDGSTANMPSYWATSTSIYPNSNATTRYWRAGRTYKWIAVWAPTT